MGCGFSSNSSSSDKDGGGGGGGSNEKEGAVKACDAGGAREGEDVEESSTATRKATLFGNRVGQPEPIGASTLQMPPKVSASQIDFFKMLDEKIENGNEDVLSSPLAPDDDSAGIWISSADDNFSTNNNNNNNNDNDNDSYSASKPASATIVTVVKKGGKTTAEESSFVGGGGSADSMRTVFSNSTNALGSVREVTTTGTETATTSAGSGSSDNRPRSAVGSRRTPSAASSRSAPSSADSASQYLNRSVTLDHVLKEHEVEQPAVTSSKDSHRIQRKAVRS